MRMRNLPVAARSLRLPLMRPGRTLREFPFELEQVLEEMIAPLRRRLRPRHLKPARDRVAGMPGAKRIMPTESLRSDIAPFTVRPHVRRRPGPVRLAERMPTRDQRHR